MGTVAYCVANGMGDATTCNQPAVDAQSKVDAANTRNVIGYVGAGVGLAAATLGVILLVTNDNPHKYDAPSSGEMASGAEGPTEAPPPGRSWEARPVEAVWVSLGNVLSCFELFLLLGSR